MYEDATLKPITSSISSSIRLSSHVEMDNLTTSASRNYYQSIVNDDRTTYDQKKLKVYLDLVLGSKSRLNPSLVSDIFRAFLYLYHIILSVILCNI